MALLALTLVSGAGAQSAEDQQAQHPGEGTQEAPIPGVRTVVPHEAVFDAEHRPITAGGFVKDGPVIFQDISESSGLAKWHNTTGTPEKTFILETVGAGVGLLDYDNDGWLDIYLVNGATYDSLSGKSTPPHAALFHNNHDGTFTDVTAKSGRSQRSLGRGRSDRRLRQRWLAGYLCVELRQEPALTGTIMTAPLPTSRIRRVWPSATGRPARRGETTTGTASSDLFVPGYVHYDVNDPPAPGSLTLKMGEVQQLLKTLQHEHASIRAINVKSQFCQFRGIPVMWRGPEG